MGWLAPLFLALGAIALAIPVIVHLIQRERNETVAFPSLMFLQRIPYRSMRRQKIRNWLLFLVRCAALILLAAAFARPFLDRDRPILGSAGGSREMVLLLDRSYSMGYGDNWTRAVAAARNALADVVAGDRVTVVFFSDRAQAVTQAIDDRAALMAAIDSTRPGSSVTRYGPALRMARQILEQSSQPRRELVLISDFQRTGWDPDEAARLPAGSDFRPVNVAAENPANVSVAGVSFQRDYPQGRERVLVSARVTNKGASPVRRLAVALELGGRELQRQSVDVAANGAASVTFAAFMLPDGVSRGVVRAADDALTADNAFHFVLAPGQAVSALVLESTQNPAQRSFYLRRALSVGERPPFRVETRRGSQLTRSDLAGRTLVVSNDAGLPSGEAGRQLVQFVTAGGGLIIALGERSAPAAFGAESRPLLPGRIGAVVDRPGSGGGRITQMDMSHPVFEPFGAPRSGDFSSARFFRYRGVTPDSSATVLAHYDDGAPALIEKRVGSGTVLLWTSTLDNFWGDLPVQPVYLPFVHQLAKRAVGYTETQPWFTVGQAVDIADRRVSGQGDGTPAPPDPREELVAESPSGGRTVVPPGSSRVVTLAEHGFYEVRRPGQSAGSGRIVAANLDLAETDLTPVNMEEFAGTVRPQGGPAADAAGNVQPGSAEDRERRQAIWWYLLIGAFLALVAEALLANRLSRTAAT